MSFKCGICGVSQFPGIKPTMTIVAERDMVYENIVVRTDPDTLRTSREMVHSAGQEIVRELAVCPPCLGQAIVVPPPVDLRGFKLITMGCSRHIRGDGNKIKPCKAKAVEDCKSCKSIVAGFAQFPLHILSECIQDIKAKPMMISMGAIVLDRAIDNHVVGQIRDYAAAAQVLKVYEEMGGKIR